MDVQEGIPYYNVVCVSFNSQLLVTMQRLQTKTIQTNRLVMGLDMVFIIL